MVRGEIPDVCVVFYENGNLIENVKVVHERSRFENNDE
jgi:hypothetical protein